MTVESEFFEAGVNLRRDMFGPAGAEQAIESATEFTKPLQDIVTRYCFGEIWNREPLDRKTRSLLTLAIVSALNRPNQFKTHVRGALKNGVTKDEIREVILHTMVYAGVPSAVDSFASATEVLKELGLE